MNSKNEKRILPVPNVGPKPGDFPLGSMKSRAAARSQLQQKTNAVPRVRIFEDGVLVQEYAYEGMKGDVILYVNNIGRCAEDITEPVGADRLGSSEENESHQSRTQSDRTQKTPNEEAALDAAREARVIEYGKYLARRWRPRRGYRPRLR